MASESNAPGELEDTGLPDEEGVPRDRPRGVVRKMLSGFLSYGVVILVFVFLLPKLTSTDDLATSLSLITPAQVVVVLLLGLFNLFTNLPPIVITLPGLRYREAGVTNMASAAISNTVPEGGAVATGLNFAMLRSWGFRLGDITSSYLTTGIWTNLVRYGLVAIALLVMAAEGDAPAYVVAIAIVVALLMAAAIALLAFVLRSEPFARRLGALLGRVAAPFFRLFRRRVIDDMDERTVAFRIELLRLVKDRWHALTGAMLLSQLSACLVLLVAVRMQGLSQSEISVARVVVAYGTMSLASLLMPTPGGVGVAEVALVAVLGAGLPESLIPQVTAAVLLFRLATWLLPIPIGAGTYLFWRYNKGWRMTEEEREARDGTTAALLA